MLRKSYSRMALTWDVSSSKFFSGKTVLSSQYDLDQYTKIDKIKPEFIYKMVTKFEISSFLGYRINVITQMIMKVIPEDEKPNSLTQKNIENESNSTVIPFIRHLSFKCSIDTKNSNLVYDDTKTQIYLDDHRFKQFGIKNYFVNLDKLSIE
jgi:hypothetical protein